MTPVTAALARTTDPRDSGGPVAPLAPAGATGVLLVRNLLAYRHVWWIFASGFLEPFFYLLSIGIGVGKLIHGFDVNGHEVGYRDFVAPAMLATSAMNGAMLDATFNFFFKLKFSKLYDMILATPMSTMDLARGEISWSLLRGGIYSLVFLLVMACFGSVHSWLAVLTLPATLLIGLTFAAVGMACTTWLRSWQDFEFVTLAQIPMFLFSGTFFPISAFPDWLRWIVECTPLYRGVVLCRELTTGELSWASAVSVGYLAVLGLVGVLVVRRRLDTLLSR